MKAITNYWFTIEPYVYINVVDNNILLYNTLDGEVVESDSEDVALLLQELRLRENCGVILLTNERYREKTINEFIKKIREKYMGDIIDINQSDSKPVQVFPIFNYPNVLELYKKHSITPYKSVLEYLSDIYIHVDNTINVEKLIIFLQSLPENLTINIEGDISVVFDNSGLLHFLDDYSGGKNILCSYGNIMLLQSLFEYDFSFIVYVEFPINTQIISSVLSCQSLSYVFNVFSIDECDMAEAIVEQFQIMEYSLNPIYNGKNLDFFMEYVFQSKEDILSTKMSAKDFFANQAMNVYDFGKIHVMSNGDAYANVNHLLLGNIYYDSICEIIQKEIDEGQSWFRIRNEAPCCNCLYQWICSSPSDYEIQIGRCNLCSVKC